MSRFYHGSRFYKQVGGASNMKITISLICLVLALAGAGYSQGPAATPQIRQGETLSTLTDIPQKVLFVKSETDDPKTVIANVLLSDTGIQLITMGLIPGMAYNPYMSETITKVAKLGKGMLLSHGNDIKGFEYDTLPGLTARTTLRADKIELLLPLDTYRPSADFPIDSVEPVLLRLETRSQDQLRLLASRHVLIKEQKKGRFDLKPTSLREETEVLERPVAIDFERQPGNVLRVTTREILEQGEYALVLRSKSEKGAATQNIPLKPLSKPEGPAAADPSALFPGMMGAPGTAPAPHSKGMFGMMHPSAAKQNPNGPPSGGNMAGGTTGAGFLAWDFRVIQ
jgi:hypothetical protein